MFPIIKWNTLTFTNERFINFRLTPGFLYVTWTTSVTFCPTSVVLASAQQYGWIFGILYIASVCMSITHTPSSNTNIFYGVKILQCTKKFGCDKIYREFSNYLPFWLLWDLVWLQTSDDRGNFWFLKDGDVRLLP